MTGPVTPSMSPAAASSASPYTAYSVSWNLTRRCNLECAHCYMSAHAGVDTRGELKTAGGRRVEEREGTGDPDRFFAPHRRGAHPPSRVLWLRRALARNQITHGI